MSNTILLKACLLREGIAQKTVADELVSTYEYNPVLFTDLFQQQNELEFVGFKRFTKSDHDWALWMRLYLVDPKEFSKRSGHDFVAFATFDLKQKETERKTFVFCAGSGFHHVAKYLDHTFGVAVLERVFDPDVNRIESVNEKGIIGDILASSRYYRRARSFAYEDDFGKYFQKINVRLNKDHVTKYFPIFGNHRKDKLRPQITVSGSSSVEVRSRHEFMPYIFFLKDLRAILDLARQPIFNRSLEPLSSKTSASLIKELHQELIDRLSQPSNPPLEIDFCHRNFEDFFRSERIQFMIPELNSDEYLEGVFFECDLSRVSEPDFLSQLQTEVQKIEDWDPPEIYSKMRVRTNDAETPNLTVGSIFEYVQTEIAVNSIPYFFLDDQWYRIRDNFDAALTSKFKDRLSKKIHSPVFIKPWTSGDETAYNKQYDSGQNPFYFHLIKVGGMEICDVLYHDVASKKLHIVHVKDGLGSAVRDLTSQVFLSARLVESELMTGKNESLKRLYDQGVKNKRIRKANISEDNFLKLFTDNARVYTLVIRLGSQGTASDIQDGKFSSRIAKFSLVEMALAMHLNDWEYIVSLI